MWNTTTTIIKQYIDSIVSQDSFGPIMFIVVVTLWYSSSFVFLLKMQTGASTEIFASSTASTTRLLVQDFRHQNHTAEILRELADKQKRDKLWDIYLGDLREKIGEAEALRIRNIEKRLASIDQSRRYSFGMSTDDSLVPCSDADSWSVYTNGSSLNSRRRMRRRSSSDYRILEGWKTVATELRANEHWPWPLQRLFIRRHLRRRYATDNGLVP